MKKTEEISNKGNVNSIIKTIQNSDNIELDCSGGASIKIPVYEIMPKEFLDYAEREIELNTKESKINAISHLRRAIECQIDLFLEALKLKRIFDKYNLNLKPKIKFLGDIGILSTKSINKLNTVRNKMEHEYKVPSTIDLQAYYDLVWYVIEIIESKLFIICCNGEVSYTIYVNNERYYFTVKFNIEDCFFEFKLISWSHCENKDREKLVVNIYLKERKDELDFIKAFKFYLETVYFWGMGDYQKYIKNITQIYNEE